jgi:hypothetical protein
MFHGPDVWECTTWPVDPLDAKSQVRCNVSQCTFCQFRTSPNRVWRRVCQRFTAWMHPNALFDRRSNRMQKHISVCLTHIRLPNHKVPCLQLCIFQLPFSDFYFYSRLNFHYYLSFVYHPRLRYSTDLRNSGGILRVKVALQYFLRLSASATTLAFSGW